MECNFGAKALARLVTGIIAIGFAVVLGLLVVMGVLSSLWWYVECRIREHLQLKQSRWRIIRAIGIKHHSNKIKN